MTHEVTAMRMRVHRLSMQHGLRLAPDNRKREDDMPISYEDSLRLTDHIDWMAYILNLPRISEDEWDERFGWMPNEDGDQTLLEDTPEVRALLANHDPHYVWTQIDGEEDILIVPGFVVSGGIGWYLCERPWDSDSLVVAQPDRSYDAPREEPSKES